MEPREEEGLGRREFVYFLGGLGAANATGLGTWLTLEALVPKGNADEYHNSVCRYCGTGCGIRVGLRDGQISDIRGDEQWHRERSSCCWSGEIRHATGDGAPLFPFLGKRLQSLTCSGNVICWYGPRALDRSAAVRFWAVSGLSSGAARIVPTPSAVSGLGLRRGRSRIRLPSHPVPRTHLLTSGGP